MLANLLNKKFVVIHNDFLINNNKRFPLVPEIPVVNLKRKKRVAK